MGSDLAKGLAFVFNPALAINAVTGAKAAEEGVKAVDEVTGAKAARDEAAKVVADGQARQEKLIADQEAATKQDKLDAESIATRDAARKRQKQKMTGGIASTIMTSPLGMTGGPGLVGKTLLGQ